MAHSKNGYDGVFGSNPFTVAQVTDGDPIELPTGVRNAILTASGTSTGHTYLRVADAQVGDIVQLNFGGSVTINRTTYANIDATADNDCMLLGAATRALTEGDVVWLQRWVKDVSGVGYVYYWREIVYSNLT